MRVPRVRYKVRRLMVAVATVAMILGIVSERRRRFQRLAQSYIVRTDVSGIANAIYWGHGPEEPPEVVFSDGSRMLWFDYNRRRMLRRKYEFAARYPWLPVAPDPPETE